MYMLLLFTIQFVLCSKTVYNGIIYYTIFANHGLRSPPDF